MSWEGMDQERVKPWHSLPREVVALPSLKCPSVPILDAGGDLEQSGRGEGAWNGLILKFPPSLKRSLSVGFARAQPREGRTEVGCSRGGNS